MTQRHETGLAREELELLFAEIEIYLEVVDTFRREGREPCWRRDAVTSALA